MPTALLTELERFATALIQVQTTLLETMRRKRIALTTSNTAMLSNLQARELEAAQKLQVLVTWRAKLLQSAKPTCGSFETLSDLARALPGPRAETVTELLEQARQSATELQQESWVQWVITNRCCNFYGEVLELIAQGGKKPPTYSPTDWANHGGALIDASA